MIEELAGLGQLRALVEPAVFVHGDVRIFISGDDAVDVPAAGGDDLLRGDLTQEGIGGETVRALEQGGQVGIRLAVGRAEVGAAEHRARGADGLA